MPRRGIAHATIFPSKVPLRHQGEVGLEIKPGFCGAFAEITGTGNLLVLFATRMPENKFLSNNPCILRQIRYNVCIDH